MADRETYLIQLSDTVVPLIWQEPPAQLTDPERVFIGVWQLEAEVNNGGFSQYYSNSAGDLATEAPAALEAIGARHTAEIVRSANDLFRDGPPRDRDAREELAEQIPESAFEALSDRFLSYEDDLSLLLYEYVQLHKNDIRGA